MRYVAQGVIFILLEWKPLTNPKSNLATSSKNNAAHLVGSYVLLEHLADISYLTSSKKDNCVSDYKPFH